MTPLSLRHLRHLTDHTGMIQHARLAVRDPHTGYTADDNSRALVLAARLHQSRPSPRTERLMHMYLAFLQYVQQPDGRFLNLVGYDRTILPGDASEDCLGRCVWACAEVIRCAAAPDGLREAARAMLRAARPHVEALGSLRGRANALLGAALLPEETDLATMLAHRLVEAYDRGAGAAWRWFEPVLTYDLGRMPQSLFRAARMTGRARYREVAAESLAFLIETQTLDGVLAPIGNYGWYPRGGARAVWDQQSLEAGALVEACADAWAATGDPAYLGRARWAFGWYLGENLLRVPLYDPSTGGCFDALAPTGPNLNQGAEALVTYGMAHTALRKTPPVISHDGQGGPVRERLALARRT